MQRVTLREWMPCVSHLCWVFQGHSVFPVTVLPKGNILSACFCCVPCRGGNGRGKRSCESLDR